MLGGFILLDLMLVQQYPEKKNVHQLVFALLSLLGFFFLISIVLVRRKK